jgi:class III poly(R)-hydroxyalkanoic acid synthase PhaE subunit
MESWADWASTAFPFSPTFVEQWGKMVKQSMESWKDETAPIARNTAEQYLAVQETSMQFLEFSERVWKAMGPNFATGEDWQASFERTLEEGLEQWAQLPTTLMGTVKDVNGLWQLYTQQWQSFGQPWTSIMQAAPDLSRASLGDSTALTGLSDLFRDAYEQTLGRLVTSPNLGMTREMNEKIQAGFDAYVTWQLAAQDYQAVLADTWGLAINKYMEELVSMAERDEQIDNVRQLILLWTRGAEKIFTEAFRTEKYVLTQGKMLNAAMAYRVNQRLIIEDYLKSYDLPTRSELDEAHRRIYELRKEVKALKKAVAKMNPEGKGTKS